MLANFKREGVARIVWSWGFLTAPAPSSVYWQRMVLIHI